MNLSRSSRFELAATWPRSHFQGFAAHPPAIRFEMKLLHQLLVLALALQTAVAAPNIVYIIPDDQTFRDFGFMGSKDALTPHIDRLAEKSARFVNGYVPTSLCSPSLATMLTGRYPHESGLHYNHPPPGNSGFNRIQTRREYEAARSPAFEIMQNLPTLPRALAQRGYVSLQTGKFWEGHYSNAGFTHGMTIFEPRAGQDYGGNRVLKSGELAAHGNGDHGLQIGRETMQPIADFLNGAGKSKPFFIWYAPFLPHQPHDSPPRYHELHRQRGAAEHRIPYLASISQFDDTVAELMRLLEERGLIENTLIVLCADNGWTPSIHRMAKSPKEFEHTHESKYSPFEDGLRTPILVSLPGVVRPATHPQLVSSVDLLPTVLSAIGELGLIADLPGRSLWAAATGGAALDEKPVFGEIYPGDASSLRHPERDIAYRWVREGEWKLILPHSNSKQAPWGDYLTEPALYHLTTDPDEKQNLAELEPERVNALRALLNVWWTPDSEHSAK